MTDPLAARVAARFVAAAHEEDFAKFVKDFTEGKPIPHSNPHKQVVNQHFDEFEAWLKKNPKLKTKYEETLEVNRHRPRPR